MTKFTDDAVRYEQCIRCLRWYPYEEMLSDEEGHEFLCAECCPIIHIW